MPTLKIIIDTREKQPISFPASFTALNRVTKKTTLYTIETSRETLAYGDYLAADARHAVVIERKKNLRELCGNCLVPRKRANFIRELENLRDRACFPWILVEGTIDELESGPGDYQKNIHARDSFLDLMHEYGVLFMCTRTKTQAQRLACGRWVAATLLSGIHHGNHSICDQKPRA